MSRVLICCVTIAWACTAQAEVLFNDSFEAPGRVNWRQSWGPVERSRDHAHEGQWSIKQTLEDRHGLSVWYVDIEAHPGALYRATAWVFVPEQEKAGVPCLSLNRPDWSALAAASTPEQGRWVELNIEHRNRSERRIRLQLFQQGQRAGLGGAVMYWDSVTVERELGEISLDDGIRINPHVQEGLDVTPLGGMRLRVAPGRMDVDGQAVEVGEETVLELAPPRVVHVRDEAARLTDEEPQGYGKGTPLRGCQGPGSSVAGCLVPESLVIKADKGPEGRRLAEGTDWRADKTWGRVGRLPDGEIAADAVVYIDYDYSLMRLDTIAVRSDGAVVLRTGAEHKMIPQPTPVDQHALSLCNVFVPYHCRELSALHIYPVGPPFLAPAQEELERNTALIPASREKLSRGGEFTLLFWGDSVTCGGDVSRPELSFPRAFTTWLRDRFPQAHIKYVNAGTGGWNSNSKLPLFQQEVLDHRPDLVVIEFVNDMGMSRENIFRNYAEAVGRIRAIGGEVIILTPHFVRPDWMGAGTDMRTPETRAAVGHLREFAAEHNVALADASRRWAHLWIEGLPYITLLYNAINHPDDRGHWLFVEELQKFFAPM